MRQGSPTFASAWAETTASTYGSAIRPFLPFCAEHGVPALVSTAATVARYIAWQGLRGTIKVASLQPYLSAINGFYRDHGAEPVAQGDLISKFTTAVSADCQQPGAVTAAYAIGVALQKIKHFGSWAQLSNVVLD
eukprot:jgi/Tetstr1/425502/TSEL_015948.t1